MLAQRRFVDPGSSYPRKLVHGRRLQLVEPCLVIGIIRHRVLARRAYVQSAVAEHVVHIPRRANRHCHGAGNLADMLVLPRRPTATFEIPSRRNLVSHPNYQHSSFHLLLSTRYLYCSIYVRHPANQFAISVFNSSQFPHCRR